MTTSQKYVCLTTRHWAPMKHTQGIAQCDPYRTASIREQ